jgi:hypothetical protein
MRERESFVMAHRIFLVIIPRVMVPWDFLDLSWREADFPRGIMDREA